MKKNQLPSGFNSALMQNEKAMVKFHSLTEKEQQFIVDRAQTISTKHEMKSFVNSLVESTGF